MPKGLRSSFGASDASFAEYRKAGFSRKDAREALMGYEHIKKGQKKYGVKGYADRENQIVQWNKEADAKFKLGHLKDKLKKKYKKKAETRGL